MIQDITFLANIDTLQYHFRATCNELLTKRAIRRISCIIKNGNPVPAIRRIPNKHIITHLSIDLIDLREPFSSEGLEFNKFRNLQHVGTLSLRTNYYDTEEAKVGKVDFF